MPEQTVSVLLAVHAATPAAQLAEALVSVAAQTRPPDQVVVVVDGPVGAAHEAVLASHPEVERVDLPRSRGLGPALAAGLARCTGRWVARADADDLNEPERLARQVAALGAAGAHVCSAAMTEVAGDPPRVLGVRGCPTTHESVVRRMRLTNPVNHPTSVFDRERAVAAGGYQDLPFLEDYDLWARMWAGGARFVGVAEPLVRFRVDGMLERRVDPRAAAAERELQRRLRSYGLVSRPRTWVNLAVRGVYRRLPPRLLGTAYARVFRRG